MSLRKVIKNMKAHFAPRLKEFRNHLPWADENETSDELTDQCRWEYPKTIYPPTPPNKYLKYLVHLYKRCKYVFSIIGFALYMFSIMSVSLMDVRVELVENLVPSSYIAAAHIGFLTITLKYQIHHFVKAIIYASFATIGYFCSWAGGQPIDANVKPKNLKSFELRLMNLKPKYSWVLITPFVIQVMIKCIEFGGNMIMWCNDEKYVNADDFKFIMPSVLLYYIILQLMANKLILLPYLGWSILNAITEKCVCFGPLKSFFIPDVLQFSFKTKKI